MAERCSRRFKQEVDMPEQFFSGRGLQPRWAKVMGSKGSQQWIPDGVGRSACSAGCMSQRPVGQRCASLHPTR